MMSHRVPYLVWYDAVSSLAAILMKSSPGPASMPGKSKPKASRTSRAAKPRKATASRRPSRAGAETGAPAPRPIGQRIRDLEGWRSETLSRIRTLILEADPEVVEEVKWRKPSNAMQGVPVWSHDGILCTGETYKDKVKLTFLKGASLEDPAGLFNSSLDGGARRAIDIHEGESVDAAAFKDIVRAAVAENSAARRQPHR